jgi:glyoxylase-like metal-dependent hydrolase (beta-lactamase superfamily II)
MTALALRTRRMLLRDMGKAGLAVMFLGTAACASEATENATPTPPTSDDTSTTPSSSSTSATGGESTSSSAANRGLEWHRVDLGFVSAYLIYRSGEAFVVDTGVSDSQGAIEQALIEIGLGWDSVGGVIITHKHPDHQGSLEAVLGASSAPWYAGAGDIQAINASTEGRPVGDGDRVFDLEIIETPGHTPGHVSVLDSAGGVLVAGDAINGDGGGIVGPNPGFSEDMELAIASVAKLAGFEYEVVLFGHGEPVTESGSSLVSELARAGS